VWEKFRANPRSPGGVALHGVTARIAIWDIRVTTWWNGAPHRRRYCEGRSGTVTSGLGRLHRTSRGPESAAAAAEAIMSGFIWIVIIGFVAGLIARFLSPGPNNPSGFILTVVLGIAGAFLATFIGQAIGWYRPDQGAGLISATIGALVVLFIWHRLVAGGVIRDPGMRPR
jgi:uncharacterized membrane protein YeaQ/YmgE (transglycosylase-associated protein family)